MATTLRLATNPDGPGGVRWRGVTWSQTPDRLFDPKGRAEKRKSDPVVAFAASCRERPNGLPFTSTNRMRVRVAH